MKADRDVVLAKASTIRKATGTIRDLPALVPQPDKEWMRQDLAVLNLQRAAEACIDLANHLIAENGWEVPRDARNAFEILANRGALSGELLVAMRSVVGFRNVAVHDYTTLDPAVVRAIVEKNIGDLERFAATVVESLDLT
ncbi:MAG: DUF86 domain-containing protein [Acidobacteria bacterium]|nr:MAG: DUF86 domain-containing protein [Acidobacteriota bacterium]MCE7956627.1 DUF86 domain-containing protein [Acidobacteria bacterium ACB2]